MLPPRASSLGLESALPCPAGRRSLVAEDRSAGGVVTGRDRNPDAHEIAHGTGHDTPGWTSTGWDDVAAAALLEGLVEASGALASTPRGQFRSRCVASAGPMDAATATLWSAAWSGRPRSAARRAGHPVDLVAQPAAIRTAKEQDGVVASKPRMDQSGKRRTTRRQLLRQSESVTENEQEVAQAAADLRQQYV
jgi:hypothetical protein